MFLWCMSELCPFASMIRQFRCPLTLQTAALHRAALAFLYLRQHPNDARTDCGACNTQKQSKLFQCEILHAHLPPIMTEMLRVLEPVRL